MLIIAPQPGGPPEQVDRRLAKAGLVGDQSEQVKGVDVLRLLRQHLPA
jgi:hypothetical protein